MVELHITDRDAFMHLNGFQQNVFSHVHLWPFFASIQHLFSPCSQVSCEHVSINKEPNISQEMQHIGLYQAETNVPLDPKLSHREKRNCNITRVRFVWLKIF